MNLTLNVIRLIGFEPQGNGCYCLRVEAGGPFFLMPLRQASDGTLVCQFRCLSAAAEEWTEVSKVEDLITHAYANGFMAASDNAVSYGIVRKPVERAAGQTGGMEGD
jgi:hypothetical protein